MRRFTTMLTIALLLHTPAVRAQGEDAAGALRLLQAVGVSEKDVLAVRTTFALPEAGVAQGDHSIAGLLDANAAWREAASRFGDARALVGVPDPRLRDEQLAIAYVLLQHCARGVPAIEAALDGDRLDEGLADRAAVAMEGSLVIGAARAAVTCASLIAREDPDTARSLSIHALRLIDPLVAQDATSALIGAHALRVVGESERALGLYASVRTLAPGLDERSEMLRHEAVLGALLAVPDDEFDLGRLLALIESAFEDATYSSRALSCETAFLLRLRAGIAPGECARELQSLYAEVGVSIDASQRARMHGSAGGMGRVLLRRGVAIEEMPVLCLIGLHADDTLSEDTRARAATMASGRTSQIPITDPARVDAVFAAASHDANDDLLLTLHRVAMHRIEDPRVSRFAILLVEHATRAADYDERLARLELVEQLISTNPPEDQGTVQRVGEALCTAYIDAIRGCPRDVDRVALVRRGIGVFERVPRERLETRDRLVARVLNAGVRLLQYPEHQGERERMALEAFDRHHRISRQDAERAVYVADAMLAIGRPKDAVNVLGFEGVGSTPVILADVARVRIQAAIETGDEEGALDLLLGSYDALATQPTRLVGDRRASLRDDVIALRGSFIGDRAGGLSELCEESAVLRLSVLVARERRGGANVEETQDAATALIACGRVRDALTLLADAPGDSELRLLSGEAMLASGDDRGAFGAFRAVALATGEDAPSRATRAHWHAWARMLEILSGMNEDGSRTEAIESTVRRLRALPSWGAHPDCVDRIERISAG